MSVICKALQRKATCHDHLRVIVHEAGQVVKVEEISLDGLMLTRAECMLYDYAKNVYATVYMETI